MAKANKTSINLWQKIGTWAWRPIVLLSVWYLFAWSWTFQTDSLELAGSKPQALVIGIFVVIINVSLSLVVMLNMAKYVDGFFIKKPTWQSALIAWPLFALADLLIAWITTIIWIGPEGRLDNILPLASPALVLINTPFGFASRFVGFFGLAGLFWTTAYLLWHKKTRGLVYIPLSILAVLSLAGWLAWKTPDGQSVQTKIISEKLDDRVEKIDPGSTDLIIFPEYGLDNQDNIEDIPRFTDKQSDKNTFYLGSEQVVPLETVGHYNVLVYGGTKFGEIKRQDKYRLIPGGEDLPYVVRIGLRATNQKTTLDFFSYAKGVISGDKQLEPFRINQDLAIGAGICSSIISPSDYRTFSKNGATILTNSASLTTFKGSRLFAWQQRSLARFMAVSNSRYFLQSANAAPAYALDNNGQALAHSDSKAIVDVTAQSNTKRTFYTQFGEILALAGGIVMLGLAAKSLLVKTPAKNKRK